MDDLSVIDRFLDVFSRYIDSGLGLLGGDVRFLTATLIGIDMTLAGLFWAMGGNDVVVKFIRKILYVGAFAFILSNFNTLSGIVFRSFAGLGLTASGSTLTAADLLHPGRIAAAGVNASRPILKQVGTLSGFPEVFLNLDSIAVLGLAWLVVIVSFFVLAVQLFVTLIEFKLTTLAGFVLVPFALWGKTAFLAERVLGNVVSTGVKVLVLAVIVGIGSGLFGEFHIPADAEPSLDQAVAMMLAAMALLGLGIFGPGIATGLVSGAPQLGAEAAAGTLLGATGLAVVGGAAVVSGGAAATAGAANLARSTSTVVRHSRAFAQQWSARMKGSTPAAGVNATSAASGSRPSHHSSTKPTAPPWAQQLQRRQQLAHGASTAVHTLRSSDHGGSGASPTLRDDTEN